MKVAGVDSLKSTFILHLKHQTFFIFVKHKLRQKWFCVHFNKEKANTDYQEEEDNECAKCQQKIPDHMKSRQLV